MYSHNYPYEILSRFLKNYPKLVMDMENVSHNYSAFEQNSYHAEGSIWAHTMMVYGEAKRIAADNPVVLLSALLHDIGKPYSHNVRQILDGKQNPHRVSFYGHEGQSFYRAVDILQDTYADILSRYDILQVLFLVANHSELFPWQTDNEDLFAKKFNNTAPEWFDNLKIQAHCDSAGRIIEQGKNVSIDFLAIPKIQRVVDMNTVRKIRPKLTLMIGPPGSGKSTYIDNDAAYKNSGIIISRDEIVEELGEGANYSEKWNNVDQKAVDKELMKRFNMLLKEQKNIIVDMTNMSKKSRRKWINPCRQKGYAVIAVLPIISRKTLMRRQETRIDKFIRKNVIDRMISSFTYPLSDEVDSLHFSMGE